GGGIRTHGLFVPNEARYQAALRPDIILQPGGNGLDRYRCRISGSVQADISHTWRENFPYFPGKSTSVPGCGLVASAARQHGCRPGNGGDPLENSAMNDAKPVVLRET
ncbi:MAG: hypothetical protein WCK77_18820, partial [Verrucomicrobiota bacterium]